MQEQRSLRVMLSAGLMLASSAALAQDKVSLITDAGFNGRHAYYFVAIDKGYYKAAKVRIVRGQGSVDAIKQVAAGTATFGFADAGSVVLSRANDKIPVKLVAVVYARAPHAIYALKGSGIAKPKDLEGRKIANPAGGAIPKLFPAYAKAAGIDASKVTWVVAASEALPGLLALGRVDAIGQFTIGEPLLKKHAAPKELVRLTYADAGLDFYSNGIVATEATISSRSDLVKRFVGATMRGLTDALAAPKEAAGILNKYHREVDAGIAAGEVEILQYLTSAPGHRMGVIDAKRVGQTISVVSGAFQLKSPVRPEDVYAPGFVGN
jgi:NitT/TauT family transport system substrate-binding protein